MTTVQEQENAAFCGVVAVFTGGMMFVQSELLVEGIILIIFGCILVFGQPKKGTV